MSGGHTPGPWLVSASNARIEVPGRDAPICELLWPTDLRSEEETYANARLIAAAPDLLEALQAILATPSLNEPMDGETIERWKTVGMTDAEADGFAPLMQANLAIIKATGE